MEIVYSETGASDLNLIEPLWHKLLEHHRSRSRNFTVHFDLMTFDRRKDELLKKSAGGTLRIELARDAGKGELIGYCVTTINAGNQGEIESIYVEPEYHRSGIGDVLMKKALKWLEENSVTTKIVAVAAGNEEVFEFYHRYNFYPRATILEQVEPD